MKKLTLITSCAALFLLAACGSSKSNSLYYWKGYTDNVYATLQNDGNASIDSMEEYFARAEQSQQKAAPGAHAHLGLLYLLGGNRSAAQTQFAREKELFPESAALIDFINQPKKSAAANGAKVNSK